MTDYGFCGLVVNYEDEDNAVYVLIQSDNGGDDVWVVELAGGVATVLQSAVVTYVDAAILEVYRYEEDMFDIYYDGALVLAGVSTSVPLVAPAESYGCNHGVMASYATARVHSFSFIPFS
jgi:hypothetical protein